MFPFVNATTSNLLGHLDGWKWLRIEERQAHSVGKRKVITLAFDEENSDVMSTAFAGSVKTAIKGRTSPAHT